jgi:putative transposase
VDTEGLVLKAFVSEAHYYDGTVGVWLLPGLKKRFPRLKKLWADGTYAGTFVEQACALAIDVEITTRLSDLPGFQVIPRRWVSERTFAWLGNYRRLSKDLYFRRHDLCGYGSYHGSAFSSTSGSRLTFQMAS